MNEPERRVPDLSQPVNPTTGEIDRFLAKVDKRSSPHGCWIWTASKNEHGYGKFGFRTGIIKAPRMSWAVFVGVIPSGIHVLHNCPGGDNPSCVNPDHLWLGTIADNAADKVSKGRQARGDTHKSRTRPDTIKRGSNHPMSKFTEADETALDGAMNGAFTFALLTSREDGMSWREWMDATSRYMSQHNAQQHPVLVEVAGTFADEVI